MRFQVPQFIERETRIVGPLTFRQFIYLGVPAAIAFFMYFLAPFTIFVIVIVLLEGFGLMFAFVKIGGKSLPIILLNVFSFSVAPKKYIWKKGAAPLQVSQVQYAKKTAEQPVSKVKLVKESKIKNLSTKVETKS